MNVPSRILIIRFSSIGDIVLASPLIRAMRSRFPTAQIDFVTKTEHAELVRSHHALNYTFTYDSGTGFDGLRALKRRLAAERYDLVIDIHNSLRSRFIRSLRGVRDIVVIDKRVLERTALVKFKKNLYREIVSVADRYLEPVAPWGIVNDGKGLELHITDEVLFGVNARMARLRLHRYEAAFGLCPGARHFTKRWPAERFAAAGTKLAQEFDGVILLFGGPEDRQMAEEIAATIGAEAGPERVINLAGELSLMETAAAFEYVDVVVTNDSGLMHLASARHRPLVAVFGSTVREFGFFPVHSEATTIEVPGLGCRPCSHIGRAACPEGHLRCLTDTTVEAVVRAVRERKTSSGGRIGTPST
ncbi:MAG: lipopolysaccharide heptosyltransferase II [Bacteroidetes bacterium]|nr:lipopolysaccharide heptosyltransferase II [Bacteroidota bacterium]